MLITTPTISCVPGASDEPHALTTGTVRTRAASRARITSPRYSSTRSNPSGASFDVSVTTDSIGGQRYIEGAALFENQAGRSWVAAPRSSTGLQSRLV